MGTALRNRRLKIAFFLNLIFQALLVAAARYRGSYDAYTHMLFADHYRTDWWSLWDPHWYSGFSVTSYPPLVHQLIGLLGHMISIDSAYALVSFVLLSLFPLAVYAFSRIFISRTASGYAALGSAFLPSIYLAAHTFGQLPTLTATLFALFATHCFSEFLKTGSRLSFFLGVLLVACTMAAHHATLLLLPWLGLSVILAMVLQRQETVLTLAKRSAGFITLAGAAGFLVIWPFWLWGASQSMQTPIDHGSRHNFLQDGLSALIFFWAIYGPIILLFPYALFKAAKGKYLPLAAALIPLVILGLGGTTPIPRLIFGQGWAWLTYDRFSLWASLLFLPYLGLFVIESRAYWRRKWLRPSSEHLLALAGKVSWRFVVFGSLGLVAGINCLYPVLLPTQPAPVNMQPILDFLDAGQNSQWRYLTFGFGDQFALLNRLASASTIDGSYHTAREIPELRSSGIGQIDTAYWLPGGMAALPPVLKAANRYSVRWGFVDYPAYIPLLKAAGWFRRTTLINGIQVWENPAAAPPQVAAPPAGDLLQSCWWGFVPMWVFILTVYTAFLKLNPTKALVWSYRIQSFTTGLLPVSFFFWYFRRLTDINVPRVYFTYDNINLYTSDFLAVLLISFALVAYWFYYPKSSTHPIPQDPASHRNPHGLSFWVLMLLPGFASLSILWSQDRFNTAYFAVHLWLVFLLGWAVSFLPRAWRFAALGFCAALCLQIFTGFWEALAQSTSFLSALKMEWPGALLVSQAGASVVQRSDGLRWLRAYGTLPHPNILGTFLVAALALVSLAYLRSKKSNYLLFLLFGLGLFLLGLTFSRAAWLGFACFALILVLRWRSFPLMRLCSLGFAVLAALLPFVFQFQDQVFVRVTNAPVATEEFSAKARNWLALQAVEMIQKQPLTGSGAGSFVLELAKRAPVGYLVEPVHNLFLLLTTEMGLIAGCLLIILAVTLGIKVKKSNRPVEIILLASLAGLLVTGIFDHTLWSLAPGRMLVGFMVGLLQNQKLL